MNKPISKNRFRTLGKELAKNGINIKYMVDWGDPERSYTDQPYLGSGTYNGIEGWYFRKDNNVNYTNKEKKLIKEILLKKGFKCKGIDDYEVEWDNDRSYPPSISFINNK
jgi:hypothetical protein|tara:strand:- start:415 stop:744 length:330 start_codon:yes stop_codon:yes gene_type:complete